MTSIWAGRRGEVMCFFRDSVTRVTVHAGRRAVVFFYSVTLVT